MKKVLLLTVLVAGFLTQSQAQNAQQNYINKYKDLAIEQMNRNGVPASVILAVAMHESASGTSKIARNLNNHFGIKGKNQVKSIRSAYKSYDSVAHSYAHFVQILKERSAFNKLFSRYSSYDYKNWVRGIQRGGYAHSKTWGSQVLGFIRKYQLYQFDNRPANYIEPVEKMDTAAPADGGVYKVKHGDTLSGIAKRLGTSVKTLMKKNGLTSSRIKPGQKLKY